MPCGGISVTGAPPKSYWVQWKSPAAGNGVLGRHLESVDGKKELAQVKEVTTEMRGGISGGHLGTNKTIDKVRKRYYWLHLRGDVERWRQ